MRILVTGGEGFIGQYVKSRGKELGHEIWTYDLASGGNILDLNNLRFAAEGCDGIIHLSGVLGTHELYDNIDTAIDVNIKGAVNIAKVAIEQDVKLVSIEQPHIWYNVYEGTKFGARRILTGLHYDYGLRVDFVTAHNAFGPGQAHGDGHPQKIIPTFATKAWLGEDIPVWGDGQQQVNLVYAGHVADVLLDRVATEKAEPLREWQAGGQHLASVDVVAWQVANIVAQAGGPRAEIDYQPMRKGEQSVPYPIPDDNYFGSYTYAQLKATVLSYRPD